MAFDVETFLEKVLYGCSVDVARSFFFYCLNAMLDDMKKGGVSTYGYRIFIQMLCDILVENNCIELSKVGNQVDESLFLQTYFFSIFYGTTVLFFVIVATEASNCCLQMRGRESHVYVLHYCVCSLLTYSSLTKPTRSGV